jgi:hypothetical protein
MGRETAVFGMLVRTRLRHSPVHAAEFAASVFNKSVEVTEIEGGLCFEYTGGLGVIVNTIRRIGEPRRHDPKDRDNALKNRRDKILREAPRLIRNATGKDREWLEVSMLTLDSVFNALALGDDEALQMSFAILRRIGWHVSTSPIQKFISEKATRSDR